MPREQWALINGRPLVVVYNSLCCDNLEYGGELWRAVKAAFETEFGVAPWLVLENTWWDPQTPPAGLPSIPAVADGRYRWGAALIGPQTYTVGDWSTTGVGPGFDNATAPGAQDDYLRDREDGRVWERDLAAIPPDTDLVLIETWNEWLEGTAVAPAPYRASDGGTLPEGLFLDALRRWRYGPQP